MVQKVRLKQCSCTDLSALIQVAQQSYREHYRYLWINDAYAEWYINKNYSAESLTKQIADPDTIFFLVIYNNKTAGYLKLNINKSLDRNTTGKSMELERIYLLKEVLGKGLGTEAMKEVIAYARKINKGLIWLKTMDSSPAVHFYTKIGFIKCGTEWLPFEGFKDEYRNMFIMCMTI